MTTFLRSSFGGFVLKIGERTSIWNCNTRTLFPPLTSHLTFHAPCNCHIIIVPGIVITIYKLQSSVSYSNKFVYSIVATTLCGKTDN